MTATFNATVPQIASALRSPLVNVRANWPTLEAEIDKLFPDRPIAKLMTLATIACEDRSFTPINEFGGPSYFTKLYEGRQDLGNIHPGDGIKYHGRGYVQTTGRANYHLLVKVLGVDVEAFPDRLLEPVLSAKAMAYYLKSHGCVDWAEKAIKSTIPRCAFCEYGGLVLDSRFMHEKRSYRRPHFQEPTCAECAWKTARRTVNGGLNGYEVFRQAVRALTPFLLP